MPMKYTGAMLIILGCGGFGFAMAASYRREERLLFQLRELLQYMYCELQFHMTSLPQLCRMAGERGRGSLGRIMVNLARELDTCVEPNALGCMKNAMEDADISHSMRDILCCLGSSLGCFDLEGQLHGLEELRDCCTRELEKLSAGREDRLRSYQTLGLCAGAALVILFV